MSDADAATEQIAVSGEAVTLEFESTDNFAGAVNVMFTVSLFDGPPGHPDRTLVPILRWSESLPSSVPPGDPPKKLTRVSWTVALTNPTAERLTTFDVPDLTQRLCIVTFEANGQTSSGRLIRGLSANRLRVPGITLTELSDLHRIMIHEFVKQDGTMFSLDKDALLAKIQALTIEQRKLLATYDVGSRSGRLVVFFTFQGDLGTLMYADACASFPTSVHPNASFSVYACQGGGEVTTLLCHTDNFVINTANSDTRKLFAGGQGGKGPDAWLSPHNQTPPRFHIASHCASYTDSVVWSRIFTDKGKDVMPGNSIHGIINTVGCWMLFRNYNWPVSKRLEMFRVYAKSLRMHVDAKVLRAKLAALGYDQPSTGPGDPNVESAYKFLFCDLNYAYNFFFRDVVGIQFFAETSTYYRRFANLRSTHGLTFEPVFAKLNLPIDRYLYHDTVTRSAADHKRYVPPDSVWQPNAFGFQTADGFLPDGAWKQNLTPEQLDKRTWADCYFYKPDALSLAAALSSPFGQVP